MRTRPWKAIALLALAAVFALSLLALPASALADDSSNPAGTDGGKDKFTLTVVDSVQGDKTFTGLDKGTEIDMLLDKEGMLEPPAVSGHRFIGYYTEESYPTTYDEYAANNDIRGTTLDSDMTIKAFYFHAINKVNLVLDNPAVGDTASVPGITTSDTGYAAEGKAWYAGNAAEGDPYTGKFENDSFYSGLAKLDADFGYYFAQSPVVSVDEAFVGTVTTDNDFLNGHSRTEPMYQTLNVPFTISFGSPASEDSGVTTGTTSQEDETAGETASTVPADQQIPKTGDEILLIIVILAAVGLGIAVAVTVAHRRR